MCAIPSRSWGTARSVRTTAELRPSHSLTHRTSAPDLARYTRRMLSLSTSYASVSGLPNRYDRDKLCKSMLFGRRVPRRMVPLSCELRFGSDPFNREKTSSGSIANPCLTVPLRGSPQTRALYHSGVARPSVGKCPACLQGKSMWKGCRQEGACPLPPRGSLAVRKASLLISVPRPHAPIPHA